MRHFSGIALLGLAFCTGLAGCGGSDDIAGSAAPAASATSAASAADTPSGDCASAADKIQAKAKSVGFDVTVEIADCVATVRTALVSLAADGEKALAICAITANEAFADGVGTTSVVAADGTELANDELGGCQPA